MRKALNMPWWVQILIIWALVIMLGIWFMWYYGNDDE